MNLFWMFKYKIFWVVYITVCLLGVVFYFTVFSKENKLIKNAPIMYVCDNTVKKFFVTLHRVNNIDDVQNYMKYINNEVKYAQFRPYLIQRNQQVRVMEYDYDDKLAKVIILRSTSTPSKPYREDHWIWVGYLKDEPCE